MMKRQDQAHVDEGALLAWLDDELTGPERAALDAHLAACEACAARRDELAFASRAVSAALEEGDVPSPWIGLPDALRRARAERPTSLEEARVARDARTSGRGPARSGRRALAAAAGLTLLLAAGAYAIPGSPVRGWVADSIGTIAAWIGDEDGEPVPDPGPSSVAVAPVEGVVRVTVIGATRDLRIEVAPSADGQAAAAARDARFRVEAGRIEVRDVPAGELSVSLPIDAAEAVLEVDGRPVVRVRDGALVRTPDAEEAAPEIVLLTRG